MFPRSLLALLAVLCVTSFASAQPPEPYTVVSETLVLRSDYIEVDGKYTNSPGEGGGAMQAVLIIEYLDEFNEPGIWEINKSAYSDWTVSDDTVYYIEAGTTLQPHALIVDHMYVDCYEGVTMVYAEYEGMVAEGMIYVVGLEWKPPVINDRD